MGESDSRYTTGVDGVWTHVVPLEESVRSIKAHIEAVERRNKYLEEENKKLKDEHYKDEEIARLKEERDKAQKDMWRGFPISEEDDKKIKEWCKKHELEKHGGKMRKGAIGGAYTYIFTPTSIGIVCTIKCFCGETFDFAGL